MRAGGLFTQNPIGRLEGKSIPLSWSVMFSLIQIISLNYVALLVEMEYYSAFHRLK